MHAPSDTSAVSGEMLEAMSRDLARLEAMVDGLPVALYQADDQDRIVIANEECRRLLGEDAPEGQHVRDFYEDPGARDALLERVSREGGEGVAIQRLKSGVNVEERVRRQHADGQVRLVGTLVDVTEAVAYERELDRATRKLNAANRDLKQQVDTLDAFTYAVSHDLKTPLRGILAYLEAFEEDVKDAGVTLPEDASDYLRRIHEGGERMERMIRGLLDFTRMQKQSQAGEAEGDRVLDEVLESNSHLIQEGHVRVEREKLPTVPVAPPILRAVLGNLVGNAVKYADKESPRIRIAVEENGEGWTFTVADNGPGIPEAYRDQVFRLFFKAPETRENEVGGGTGVGLAIAHLAVEGWGGRIWVTEAEGGGAAFQFTIPKRASEDADT